MFANPQRKEAWDAAQVLSGLPGEAGLCVLGWQSWCVSDNSAVSAAARKNVIKAAVRGMQGEKTNGLVVARVGL